MNLNLKNSLLTAATLVVCCFIISSCQSPSNEGFRDSEAAVKPEAQKKQEKTPKDKLENTFTFVLTNTGDHPLIVEEAKASCGCTVPKKPEAPIPPGETGELEVTFKPKPSQKGPVTKTVTVTSNSDPRQKVLRIKATVQQDETEEAPAK